MALGAIVEEVYPLFDLSKPSIEVIHFDQGLENILDILAGNLPSEARLWRTDLQDIQLPQYLINRYNIKTVIYPQ